MLLAMLQYRVKRKFNINRLEFTYKTKHSGKRKTELIPRFHHFFMKLIIRKIFTDISMKQILYFVDYGH